MVLTRFGIGLHLWGLFGIGFGRLHIDLALFGFGSVSVCFSGVGLVSFGSRRGVEFELFWIGLGAVLDWFGFGSRSKGAQSAPTCPRRGPGLRPCL